MKGLVVVAVACSALALAGCSNDTGDLDAPDSPVARYDWDPSSGGDDALLEGKLALIGGCLYVVAEPDPAGVTARTVPVFTRALASWNNDTQTLAYSGVDYRVGDAVSAGGGWGEPTEDMTIPAACKLDDYGSVMYVQDSDLEPYLEEGD